jgi:hypothetical protein
LREIGLGREVGGEQGPLLAVDEADGATLPGADPHQCDGERPGKRLVGQVEEQSWACRAVGMGEEGSPEGSFCAPGHQRSAKECVAVAPVAKVGQRSPVVAAEAGEREQAKPATASFQHHDLGRASRIQRGESGSQKPAFEKRIRLGRAGGEIVPLGAGGAFAEVGSG